MVKEATSQEKITKEAILAAIKSLKSKGWDINPYTVADEAKVSRSDLYRNSEMMNLVAEARGEARSSDSEAKIKELKERIEELESAAAPLKERIEELESAADPLQKRIEELESTAGPIKERNNDLRQKVAELAEKNDALKDRLASVESASSFDAGKAAELDEAKSRLEEENRALKSRVEELESSVRPADGEAAELKEQIRELEEQNSALKGRMTELESAAGGSEGDSVSNKEFEEKIAGLEEKNKDLESKNDELEKKIIQAGAKNRLLEKKFIEMEFAVKAAREEGYQEGQKTASAQESVEPVQPESVEPAPQDHAVSFADMNDHVEEQRIGTADEYEPGDMADTGVFSYGKQEAPAEARGDEAPPTPTEEASSPDQPEPPPVPVDPTQWGLGPDEEYAPVQAESTRGEATAEPAPAAESTAPEGETAGPAPVAEATVPVSETADSSAQPAEDPLAQYENIGLDSMQYDPTAASDQGPAVENVQGPAADEMQPGEKEARALKAEETRKMASTTFNPDELQDLLNARFTKVTEEQEKPEAAEQDAAKGLAGSKFIGLRRTQEESVDSDTARRSVPAEIRKACLMLGLTPGEFTKEDVMKAWKQQMSDSAAHPDLGGDTDGAVMVNTSKETLLKWLEARKPRLGLKFGAGSKEQGKAEQTNGESKPESTDSDKE